MKSKNFPGKVNERRRSALERIERQIAAGVKRRGDVEGPLTGDDLNRLNREANALGLCIQLPAQARAIRTKKDRSGTGKLTRAA